MSDANQFHLAQQSSLLFALVQVGLGLLVRPFQNRQQFAGGIAMRLVDVGPLGQRGRLLRIRNGALQLFGPDVQICRFRQLLVDFGFIQGVGDLLIRQRATLGLLVTGPHPTPATHSENQHDGRGQRPRDFAAFAFFHDFGRFGVRVNCLRMGWIGGAPVYAYIDQQVAAGADRDAVIGAITERIPLGIIPPEEDCARAVLAFLSDQTRVITGASVDVNGGEYMAP